MFIEIFSDMIAFRNPHLVKSVNLASGVGTIYMRWGAWKNWFVPPLYTMPHKSL